jgi:hypothetical protein
MIKAVDKGSKRHLTALQIFDGIALEKQQCHQRYKHETEHEMYFGTTYPCRLL